MCWDPAALLGEVRALLGVCWPTFPCHSWWIVTHHTGGGSSMQGPLPVTVSTRNLCQQGMPTCAASAKVPFFIGEPLRLCSTWLWPRPLHGLAENQWSQVSYFASQRDICLGTHWRGQ